ncbi:DNA helicase/exodeoxyribonuclease V, subunit A [Fictibacillus enclensis]|uniref:ATP-dependent helicase/nuclease subunit A n=1 Tax=Fictibacillus enclensis TaxID=1017270 RepID=A0A0V8JC98_9BACL|nr:helicase-exonuclease AddAB subunit AddA [Fictibacillus enclensis]KSU84786.1 ATP-dependent helicase [Fictibacillus enclensis]SCB85711.1 DNA helicase/exodeoxyribonuclease V, subunit A [Fictibacillus enclensis]
MIKIAEKPKDSLWTDDQWQAIQARGQDILVAAAAGSGKTAVLVERIITMIKQEIADVDRLLIVTFTNAAAAEMRKRIGDAIEKELSLHPASLHLRRQLGLLNKASISTLHSFCIEVLRKYYYQIDLDPGFRIADDTEAELIRQEVLEDLFEEEYSKENNQVFFNVVDAYSSDRNDAELQRLILKLYDFSRSHPDPDLWLNQMAAQYDVKAENIDDLPWTKELLEDVAMQLRGLGNVLDRALKAARSPEGPAPYGETLENDLAYLKRLEEAAGQSWQDLYDVFSDGSFATMKQVRGKEVDPVIKENVKKMRDQVKKRVNAIKDDLFSRPPESYVIHLEEMAPVVKCLVELVQEFGIRFLREKQEKGLLDFSDLEHFCLEILKQPSSTIENPVPTPAAQEYRNRFVEVLVDEYQDTNLVQETIVRLVSKGNTAQGNLFMVGDVKQSIYRFRLAEPGLFLSKYKQFGKIPGEGAGLRIDLAKNFRSRNEVLDASNYIFKQIMNESVGEIEYSSEAALSFGAEYYPEAESAEAELLLINKSSPVRDEDGEATGESEKSDSETVILEARVMAEKIKQLIGTEGELPYQVLDKNTGGMRPVKYKDIVILLRATSTWAPIILEEFKRQGIPAYAELSTGYFEAIEVNIMLSLLKVIDNPLQDIPIASVLRSPIVGLTGDEMASVRLADRKGTYFDALTEYLNSGEDENIRSRVAHFTKNLSQWREAARQGSLADLIWRIYRETGYFDFVGGLPGGKQRQANLRALYDRARQYEKTSFRGLFRFLRFIERMQDRGRDLGAARALGEQEDVVRVMTIHKSKGLEFPVVFAAGLNKQFNTMDLKETVLLHKELGLGTRYINPRYRVAYPTLPQLAILRRKKMELLAEEMRVLYVALTRAKEKLYLLGTLNDLEKSVGQWADVLESGDWVLPDYERSQAKTYLDWIGRSVIRHKDGGELRKLLPAAQTGRGEVYTDPAKWKVKTFDAAHYEEESEGRKALQEEILSTIREYDPVAITSKEQEEVDRRLNWKYEHQASTAILSKQSVTELKRQYQYMDDEYNGSKLTGGFSSTQASRPRFMQEKTLTAAERGTAMHAVMQHINLSRPVTPDHVNELLEEMVAMELLTREQANHVDASAISAFFETEIGKKVTQATEVIREMPFNMALPVEEAALSWNETTNERILVQGVIDCLVPEEDGFLLIDYKTDAITNRFSGGFEGAKPVLLERYRVQLELYGKAIERILKKPVKASHLYFFDGAHLLEVK